MLKNSLVLLFLFITVLLSPAHAQECRPPAIVANTGAGNMFSPEQEMVLGELVLQRIQSDYRVIKDPELQKFLDDIGRRIIRHLPETGLTFTFHIADFPEANAFNLPGGHVYISRKLIAMARNESELAGIVGHELGHATVHHGAVDYSNWMRQILRITSVGNRKDIIEKYNLLLENIKTRTVSRKPGHMDNMQLEADRIGLYGMVAAGYDPSALYDFFDRLTDGKGKGNWFTDLFGSSRPSQVRLREMQAAINLMPKQCWESRKPNLDEFLKWQVGVVMYRDTGRREELPGLLWKRDLQPKLRSDINYIAFSADGKLLLAQDEFGITVIDVGEKKVLFQVPAEDAQNAMFTPDGKYLMFVTDGLRVEKWDLASQKAVEARELFVYYDCIAHALSPDGKYLACVDRAVTAMIIDARTSEKVWEKKDFYLFDPMSYRLNVMFNGPNFYEDYFDVEFSPDAKSAIFMPRIRNRWDVTSQNFTVAVDIPSFKKMDLSGDLKKAFAGAHAFLDGERVVGMISSDQKESGVFSYPDGKRLKQFTFGSNEIKRTENPDYIVVKPLMQTKLGILDVRNGTMLAGMNKEDVTLWKNLAAFESAGGTVVIRELTGGKALEGKDIAVIEIPIISVGVPLAASLSNSFGWMAVSSKSRGGLWNLATGERKLFVRGFRGAVVADDGGALVHFPKMGDTPTSLALLNPHTSEVTPVRETPNRGFYQYGRFVLTRTSLEKQKAPDKDDKFVIAGQEYFTSLNPLYEKVRYELRDVLTDQVVWSRDFPKYAAQYTFDKATGRLILFWGVRTESGKERLSESPEMKPKIDALGDKEGDYLVEVIDPYAKKSVGLLVVETGKGSFSLTTGRSAGDWLMLYDSADRVLVYSIKEGALKQRFFGQLALVNPVRNLIAIENYPGDITLYDLTTSDSRAKIAINGQAVFLHFDLQGNKLFVLNNLQTAYAFDLDKLAAAVAPKP
jgi:hypothetical protein